MRSTFPTFLEAAILATLAKHKEMHAGPLALKATEMLGSKQLVTSVHTALRRLSNHKFLTSKVKPQEGTRPCRMFSISASGRKALSGIRRSLVRLGK